MLYSDRSLKYTLVVVASGIVGTAFLDRDSGLVNSLFDAWLNPYGCRLFVASEEAPHAGVFVAPFEVEPEADAESETGPWARLLGVVEYDHLDLSVAGLDERPEIRGVLEGGARR
ncbi:MAG: hypothetical protein R3195_17700 [Gemmatimonadota bacterium]|nr:hypothetical protein [Gemmatimonadota bacterium]